MLGKANPTAPSFDVPVRYRLALVCGWRCPLQAGKVKAMNTPLPRTEINALPGSQRQHLDLAMAAAAYSLNLRPGQHALLQVTQGRLWLTQDGRPEDIILARGQQWALQTPGHYRLSAFGPADTQVSMWATFAIASAA